ncbi:MAG: cytochrome c biogenesis protein CcsA [Bacteroidia bacterium]|nr:cytochrome c biogenesis protein CcsA [Bacteroidia bacterium]
MQSLGQLLVGILWVTGIWGGVAAWEAHRKGSSWKYSAWGSWILHSLALVGTLSLLLYLLLGHRYEFYYAWAHGSRQLPWAYITAALWEGQEGSFLLWMLWHGILGWGLIIGKDAYRWFLIGGLLVTNGYLATFLLGVSLPEWAAAAVGGVIWLLWAAESLTWPARMVGGFILIAALIMGGIWLRLGLVGLGVVLFYLHKLSFRALVGACALLLLPVGEVWGSFPFSYLWEVRNEITPGYIPPDGNGLNPLLQSFWMVIHPPILFGGYAATALPFWESLLVMQQGGLTGEHSRRLLRFLWLAVGLLGLGIALGAYWAYETLNFGGYWNWDPVENASFAPWLVLVGAAHLIWVWRRHRRGQLIALGTALLGFPLVIYSAYLTRSGILADSSVHSFTDMGMGGWLIWGAGLSAGGSLLLLFRNLSGGIQRPLESLWHSALFVGSVLLVLIAGVLLFLTSLPAFNKLLGTSLALGANAVQVYFEWMGLLSVPLLVLMGYALLQAYRLKGWDALIWIAGALLAGIVGVIWWSGWDFVYHPSYRALLKESWIERLRGGVFLILDDLLWGAALLAIGGAFLYLLLHRSRSNVGAGLAHIGFGLLIIGAILSGGYQKVLSQNLNPRSPASSDNLFLPLGKEEAAIGYLVRYEGLVSPVPPLRDIRTILRAEGQTLWRFTDSLGYSYQVWLPDELTARTQGPLHPVNLSSTQKFLEANIAFLPVIPADNRYRYKVRLKDLAAEKVYNLLLEADIDESSGLIAHPSHVRFWHGDLYIHLTSLPERDKQPLQQTTVKLAPKDTIQWNEVTITLEKLTEVEGVPHPTFRAWLRVWRGIPEFAQGLPVEFSIKEGSLQTPLATLPVMGFVAELQGFDMKEKKLLFRIGLRTQPDSFIALKILYKPFIGLFWMGVALVLVGAAWAFFRHMRRR